MNSERAKAIGEEQKKTSKGGQGKFNYVDVKKLERMGITFYKMRQGDNFIRIISPPDLTKFYGREIFIHTKIGTEGITVLCLNKMYGEPCPVCEYRAQLQAKNVDSKILSALNYGRRYLFFVIDVKDEASEDEGLRWADFPPIIKDNIVTLSKNKRSGESIDVSDPKNGRDIEFVKTGTGQFKTRYRAFTLIDNNPIPDDWYKDVPEFDEILLKPDYDEVKEIVMGSGEEDPDDSQEEVEEEVEEVETSGRTRTRRNRTETQDEKSVEESKVEEKEVVEEVPKRTRTRRSRTEESTDEKSEADLSVKAKLNEIRKNLRK